MSRRRVRVAANARRGLLGVFAHVDCLHAALRGLGEGKLAVVDVYSPVPDEQVLRWVSPGRSGVRFVTFTGAAAGLVTGLGLALLTAAVWELVVGGKPVYSVVPIVVVGFELTILFGALFTLGGLLALAGLPTFGPPPRAYRAAFSRDRFGIWVVGDDRELDRAREILEGAGAVEVQELGEEGRP